jgi:hypothetical protein
MHLRMSTPLSFQHGLLFSNHMFPSLLSVLQSCSFGGQLPTPYILYAIGTKRSNSHLPELSSQQLAGEAVSAADQLPVASASIHASTRKSHEGSQERNGRGQRQRGDATGG